MASRDRNHATIVRSFLSHGASLVDLSNIGGGCPDLLVGYAGQSVLVEIKVPRKTFRAQSLRSTKCKNCGHDSKKHRTGFDNEVSCQGGKGDCDCDHFALDIGEKKVDPGGVRSRRQKDFELKWLGGPIVVVETPEDVESLLDELTPKRG